MYQIMILTRMEAPDDDYDEFFYEMYYIKQYILLNSLNIL